MKASIGILVLAMATTVYGQNSNVIQKTSSRVKAVEHVQPVRKAVEHVQPVRAKIEPRISHPVTARRDPAKPMTKARVAPAVLIPAKAKAEVKTVSVEAAKKNDDDALKSASKERQISLTGRRDPFLSPVVAQSASGSGCSTGKRCLAIDEISLKGVVKSENGMIAVVVNALDKAYFLHENDPVFNGYVVRITGDSIVFSETVQDKFGKPFTREVTKRIFTPAV